MALLPTGPRPKAAGRRTALRHGPNPHPDPNPKPDPSRIDVTLTRYEFIEDEESKGAQYKYGNGTYKPEEAVAFVLSYAKQIAEAHAESVIKDCVITVPPYWRHEERTHP